MLKITLNAKIRTRHRNSDVISVESPHRAPSMAVIFGLVLALIEILQPYLFLTLTLTVSIKRQP